MHINKNVPNGTLFYVDYSMMEVYTNPSDNTVRFGNDPDLTDEYIYDPDKSQARFDTFRTNLVSNITNKQNTLTLADTWDKKKTHVILENDLFQIGFEDNDEHIAVKLVCKKTKNADRQKEQFSIIEKTLRDSLLDCVPVIYTRAGSWSIAPMTRETAKLIDNTASIA